MTAHAQSLGRNLDFAQWETGGPAHWWLNGQPAYQVARDCDARRADGCVLRVHGTATSELKFGGGGQQLPASIAAGGWLEMSGWIRTEQVEGWAGFWMRVDSVTKPSIAFENMNRSGPRGTTGWQRFQIKLPVAPNASRIVFGVIVSGSGTAWFDGLALGVDRSLVVAPADIPAPTVAPRPQPSQGLLEDAALALPDSEQPNVSAEWREHIRANHHPLRSLFSDDFSDLRFLAPLLEGKRVVQLGESGHGVAEFNWMKVRLIRYLHEELGYDVIAMESSRVHGRTPSDGAPDHAQRIRYSE